MSNYQAFPSNLNTPQPEGRTVSDTSGNFQRYSPMLNDAQPENVRDTSQVRIHDTVTRTTTTADGQVIVTGHTHHQATAAELNPHHGTGSVLATARNPDGRPVLAILPTTMIEIDGLQAPVSFWVKEGRLHKTADGGYGEGGTSEQQTAQATAAAAQAPTSDIVPLSAEGIAGVNLALGDTPAGHVDGILGMAAGVVSGSMDAAALVAHFSRVSGYSPEDCHARLTVMAAPFQAQADAALTTRAGLAAGDLPEFYAWAKANQKEALRDCMLKQIHGSDVSGYRALASKWQNTVAPSLDAFRGAGVPVRNQGGKSEVFLQGSWMSPGAAARAGLA